MDYDEWERSGGGSRGGESLEDAIGRTVGNAYGGMATCPNCGKLTNTFKDFKGQCCCQHCDHTWYD